MAFLVKEDFETFLSLTNLFLCRAVINMSFGDWNLFRLLVSNMRQLEKSFVSDPVEGSAEAPGINHPCNLSNQTILYDGKS